MPAADLVLTDARVRTLDPARPEATAVAVKDGLIVAVGGEPDVQDWCGPGTETVGLAGATLTPGLVDSHSHPVWGLEMSTGLDLSAVRDLDALRAALAGADRNEGWITAWGLDHNAFGGRPVDRALIEDAVAGAPAFIRLYDGHSALASGAALDAAQITGRRTFAQRSEIVCDADGRLTGHLIEHAAMELVGARVPRPSYAERRARLGELLSAMAATGLTGAHVMDLGGDALELLRAAEETDDLPVRLLLAPWCMPGADTAGLDELVALQKEAGRLWRVGGVKFFMDGTVEGGTAWLEHADCHGQGTEAFWPDPAAYTGAVRHLHEAGVRTATHAIGDAAVRHVLDTVASLGPSGRLRHRIEHIETVPGDQIARFAERGVIASMQPPHTAYTRADHTDEWSKRLGGERAVPRLALPRPARCRRRPGPRLGLAHRPLRRTPGPGHRPCPARRRRGRPRADRPDGAGGLHHARGGARRASRPSRAASSRACGPTWRPSAWTRWRHRPTRWHRRPYA